MESARTLAEKVEAEYTTDLQAVSKDAKLYIVSLKDDALVDLLPQITEGKQASLLVHTAGSIPMSVWEGHAERYGVFYPMQTFSKQHFRKRSTRLLPSNVRAFIWLLFLSVTSPITCMH